MSCLEMLRFRARAVAEHQAEQHQGGLGGGGQDEHLCEHDDEHCDK